MVAELVETDLWRLIHEGKHSFSDGKIAAAHWFVQQQAFLRVDHAVLSKIRSLHNSEFYNHSVETLAAVAGHFGIDIGPEEAAGAFASVSNRHSKSMEKPYSMTDQRKEVELVAQNYQREITAAVAQAKIWLQAYPIPQPLPWRL